MNSYIYGNDRRISLRKPCATGSNFPSTEPETYIAPPALRKLSAIKQNHAGYNIKQNFVPYYVISLRDQRVMLNMTRTKLFRQIHRRPRLASVFEFQDHENENHDSRTCSLHLRRTDTAYHPN